MTLKTRPFVALSGIPFEIPFQIIASGVKNKQLIVQAVNGDDSLSGLLLNDFEHEKIVGEKQVFGDDDLFQSEGTVSAVFEGIGTHRLRLFLLDGPNGTVLSQFVLEDLYTIPGILCLFPSFLIVFVAVASQNVLLALFAGLYLGGMLISAYNPFTGLLRAGDTFMVDALREADMGMLLFTWFMAGLVGIISRSGGALGIGRAFAHHATTSSRAQVLLPAPPPHPQPRPAPRHRAPPRRRPRRRQGLAWAAGVAIFFDDYSSILIVGPTLRPLVDACGVSREKLAFLVDSTAAPVAAVSVLSTWIGFELRSPGPRAVSPRASPPPRDLPLCACA